MKNSDACRQIVDLTERSLQGSRRAQAMEHVRACEACQGWMATYRQMEDELGQHLLHLDSGLIAAYCVEPADLRATERAEVESHLEQCASCTREYRLTLEALAAARPGIAREDEIGPRKARAHWSGVRIAASFLVAAVLVAMVVLYDWRSEPEVLADSVIRGHRVVESDRRLLASHLEVGESSVVHLAAPRGVVLGEGFSVRRGARLSIDTEAEDAR